MGKVAGIDSDARRELLGVCADLRSGARRSTLEKDAPLPDGDLVDVRVSCCTVASSTSEKGVKKMFEQLVACLLVLVVSTEALLRMKGWA